MHMQNSIEPQKLVKIIKFLFYLTINDICLLSCYNAIINSLNIGKNKFQQLIFNIPSINLSIKII